MQQKLVELNQKLNKLVTKKNILIGMILLTVIFLIPILWVSFYTIPSADDFSYGEFTINILQSKGLFAVLSGSLKTLEVFYKTWQGTYSAIILFSLNPAVIGKDAYFLTTFFILGTYFISLLYLFKQVLRKGLQIDKTSFWIVLLLFFLLCIETIVDKTQGLFWWNGAVYYIVFFSLELIEIALLIKQFFHKEKTTKNTIGIILLNFIIAGGNFIVALQQVIILVFLNIYLIFKKKDKSALIYLGVSILGLGISALAPGNKVRENAVTGMNPIMAIIYSFKYCLRFITDWTSPINIITIFIIELFLYPTYKNNKFNFSYPLIVIGLLFCILSAEFTAPLYAMSLPGEERLWNIIYFSYLLFLSTSLYYLIGYIRYNFIKNKILNTNSYDKAINFFKQNAFLWSGSIFIIIMMALYIGRAQLTSYQTLELLTSKQAQTFKEEWNERYKVLEDDSIKEVEFERLTYYPFYNVDFTEEKDHWLNEPATHIYHKDYIVLVDKEV